MAYSRQDPEYQEQVNKRRLNPNPPLSRRAWREEQNLENDSLKLVGGSAGKATKKKNKRKKNDSEQVDVDSNTKMSFVDGTSGKATKKIRCL